MPARTPLPPDAAIIRAIRCAAQHLGLRPVDVYRWCRGQHAEEAAKSHDSETPPALPCGGLTECELARRQTEVLRERLNVQRALREGAPPPDELRRLVAAEDQAIRAARRRFVRVLACGQTGALGDLLEYTTRLVIDGPTDCREIESALRKTIGDAAYMPGGDYEAGDD
jgi:hypothetical protein